MKESVFAAIAIAAALAMTPCAPSFAQQAKSVTMDPSGVVAVPAFDFPNSGFASPQMNASRVEHYRVKQTLAGKSTDEANAKLFGMWLAPSQAHYPVTIESAKIAGVPVLIYTPKTGIKPENRGLILINLHGGGFSGCFRECGGLESIPAAFVSGIKVVSIDYREAPANRFPAASEDVAAVYAEILKTQKPDSIGIFGCSAGGVLVSQSLSWFQSHKLPRPAAAGIFCAGGRVDFGGDSSVSGTILGDGSFPPGLDAKAGSMPQLGYFASANPTDPLVSPVLSPAVMAQFPPTLVISGTRDFALSSALNLHAMLVDAGVAADLHVFEGGRHAFFYDPNVPEAGQVFRILANFFHRNLRS